MSPGRGNGGGRASGMESGEGKRRKEKGQPFLISSFGVWPFMDSKNMVFRLIHSSSKPTSPPNLSDGVITST